MENRSRAWWLAALGYMLATALLTLPAWAHPAKEWTGGPSDPMKFMEFFGWYPFAISHGHNPLLNNYVNLPNGSNMMWDTTMPLVAVVLWPVTTLFGVIASWNVALSGALVLDGWCTFAWLRRHVRKDVSAFVGGLLMVMGPYSAARAHLHLNLLFFFPMPLIFMEIEELVRGNRRRTVASGVRVGLLSAVEFLCCEEIFAIAAVSIGTVLLIGARTDRQVLRESWARVVKASGVALGAFFLLTAVPIGYQFFGPGRIAGPIKTRDLVVTDLANIVVPGGYTALDPHFAASLANRWSAGIIESDAYIGLPLLIVATFVVVRWWKDPWVRLVGLGALGAVVWSLGPFLHVDGATDRIVPLPGVILAVLPVAQDILPARFDLFTDFGLAALLALFVDRHALSGSRRGRASGAAALLLVCVTLAPTAPIAAYSPGTPRYFLAGGDVAIIRPGSLALVVPYGDSELTMAPMLWQAVSHFRFRMVSGAMITAGARGVSSLGRGNWGQSLDCVMEELQSGSSATHCTDKPVAAVRSELGQMGVKVILMGPLAYGTDPALDAPMQKFLSAVAGAPPRLDQGVLVWSYRQASGTDSTAAAPNQVGALRGGE